MEARGVAMLRHPLVQIASAWLVVVLVGYNIAFLRAAADLHWNDFGKFYYAVRSWQDGVSLYTPTIATRLTDGSGDFEFLDMNPPHFHILLLPLARLDLGVAARLWLAANALAALLSCWLTLRELGIRLKRWQWLPVLALCLGSTATMANSITAQCTGILMPCMTLAWIDARRGRWGSCGAWLGVLASIKPFLGLFLLSFAVRRHWRGILSMAVVGGLCGVAGALTFGWRSYLDWMQALSDVSWVWSAMNGSLLAILTKGLSPSPTLAPLIEAPASIYPLWLAACLLVSLWSVRALFWSTDHLFAVTILASLLMSPLGWVYYLWLALPPCLALWRHRTSVFTWAGLAYQCIPLFSLGMGQPYRIATLLVACAYAWSTTLLWLDVSSVRRTTSSTSPALVPERPIAPAAISTTA